ncbi:MAG: SOS response-associated peptidase [Acidobacteriia bacterium]|nr:SOS response-associated peptidase [Terriglobia bacterium]
MCGRFRLGKGREALKEYFGAEVDVEWSPRYNIVPTDLIPSVRQNATKPVRELSLMRWGLIPFWAKEASIGYKLINARSETAATKPAFRDALIRRRCLIPGDGFYEWKKQAKQPYCFTLRDESIFAFAGIWERWKGPDGNAIETCSILTTTPNELAAQVHDRMPVILAPDDYDLWLDPGIKDTKEISDMMKPYGAALMKAYAVSTRVNAVKNDDPQCAEPLDIPGDQHTLALRF